MSRFCKCFSQGRRSIPRRSIWKLATDREERQEKKSNVCAPATPHRLIASRGSLPSKHSCDALSILRLYCRDIGFLFPGWGFDFSHPATADAEAGASTEGSCLSCHELLSPRQGLELFRLGCTKSSEAHSLAWNVWSDLDRPGLPHDYHSPLSANGFSSRLDGIFSRSPSAGVGWPGNVCLRTYMCLCAYALKECAFDVRTPAEESGHKVTNFHEI